MCPRSRAKSFPPVGVFAECPQGFQPFLMTQDLSRSSASVEQQQPSCLALHGLGVLIWWSWSCDNTLLGESTGDREAALCTLQMKKLRFKEASCLPSKQAWGLDHLVLIVPSTPLLVPPTTMSTAEAAAIVWPISVQQDIHIHSPSLLGCFNIHSH